MNSWKLLLSCKVKAVVKSEVKFRKLMQASNQNGSFLFYSFDRYGSDFPVFNSGMLFPDHLSCRQFNIFPFN
jgi:hypothetical protein